MYMNVKQLPAFEVNLEKYDWSPNSVTNWITTGCRQHLKDDILHLDCLWNFKLSARSVLKTTLIPIKARVDTNCILLGVVWYSRIRLKWQFACLLTTLVRRSQAQQNSYLLRAFEFGYIVSRGATRGHNSPGGESLRAAPAFSQLLPIGPRATQAYAGPTGFLSVGPVANEN